MAKVKLKIDHQNLKLEQKARKKQQNQPLR